MRTSNRQNSFLLEFKAQTDLFPRVEVKKGSQIFKARNLKIATFVVVVMCVGALSYIVHTSVKYSNFPASLEEIPLVIADSSLVRTVPEDPGGAKIINQDMLIYDNLHAQRRHSEHIKRDEAVKMRSPEKKISKKAESRSTDVDAKKSKKQESSVFNVMKLEDM